jgi:nucleoside-diphosphate-sugar epimerase
MYISILGCGWLGLPLAKNLIEKGFQVKGSTTRSEKTDILSAAGISPYQIILEPNKIEGDVEGFLSETDILIIDVPPGLRNDEGGDFVGKIKTLDLHIINSSVKKVIFVSSTSVYLDSDKIPVYSELNPANGTAGNAQQLIAAEEIFKSSKSYQSTIIRFGGLFGPGRHPVKYLSGRKNIASPGSPVNLIHLDDCIGIINQVIIKEFWGETINAVYPEHPLKSVYYTKKAAELNLPGIEFNDEEASVGKIIESKVLGSRLEYRFKGNI